MNAGIVDPVVGTSPIELGVDADLRARLAEWAAGRPLVIDWFATRRCNVTVGDLTVRFPSAPLEPRYIELLPIGPVRVVAERSLLPLLAEGASLHRAGPPFLHHSGSGWPIPRTGSTSWIAIRAARNWLGHPLDRCSHEPVITGEGPPGGHG